MNLLASLGDGLLAWLAHGLLDASWWQIVLFTLVTTHITIAGVTIFLHRAQAHRALDLHAIPSHFFRFWLWLGTGQETKEWVAVHRKHHAKCETEEDPHSPQTRGIKTVLLTGTELYRVEAKNVETQEKYGRGTPDDWLERNLYTRYSWQGVGVMLAIDLMLFGAVKLKYIALIYVVIDLISVRQGVNSGGHIAHLGGALYGFLAARQLQKGRDWSLGFVSSLERIGNWFNFSRRGRLRVEKRGRGKVHVMQDDAYAASKRERQAGIDSILDKISRSGYDSLSKEEKDILFRASNEK